MVVILLIASALVAPALVQERWSRLTYFSSRFRRMLLAAAWLAGAILIVRGLIGVVVVDGRADLTFFGWPTFLGRGILFGATAWSHKKKSSPDLASDHGPSSFGK